MKTLAALATVAALLASPALAQDAKKSTTTGEAKFSNVRSDELFSSKLKGLNISNQDDEKVGEISDIAIKGNQVDAYILSVGGFLGVGERYVAVAPASVELAYDSRTNSWSATMNTTKESMKAAPEFKYPK